MLLTFALFGTLKEVSPIVTKTCYIQDTLSEMEMVVIIAVL